MRYLLRKAFTSLPTTLLAATGLSGFSQISQTPSGVHPNILLIMVDQMQTPPEGYDSTQGAAQGLKEILGFRSLSPGNPYTQYFQGMMRLRQNSVVLKKNYTASSASVPSRCCIMTGQYPDCTGVTQTDGLFKSAYDVPFLDPDGTPTIGDCFRSVGYTTHYFGKWHVSEVTKPDYLEPWGFSEWESSYPEPHGGASDNLGVYRDVVFTENIVDFLNDRGSNAGAGPWLTIASLVNPHDVSSWPINWQFPDTNGVVPWINYPPALSIPALGDSSLWGTVRTVQNGDTLYKTFRVPLNPDGFPQNNSSLPLSFTESLTNKPRCQQDYAIKWGMAFGALADYKFIQNGAPYRSPQPFQLQGNDYSSWCLNYNQFYFYCQYLADLQIRKILRALDDNGLKDNTIVVFISDHGDMLAAHNGMIQKWHSAYEEAVRVPMIISSPLVNSKEDEMREILQPSSSIDLAPTLLGLAGFNADSLLSSGVGIPGHPAPSHFAGADLSGHIRGTTAGPVTGPDGKPRTGVLYMTSDMITQYIDTSKFNQYQLFLHRVDSSINIGYPLVQGVVCQPNNVRAFCTGDWKIVQYVDPGGIEKDEWELYCLTNDPTELDNLDDHATGLVRDDAYVPGMTHQEIVMKNEWMKAQLSKSLGVEQPYTDILQTHLFQNIPNPFNGSTEISFSIPEAGRTRLSVTDLFGSELVVMVDAVLAPGLHRYTLDGNALAPGVYFSRLSTGNQQMTRKMIVIR